ncbi:MAG: alpha/beta hydrolase [Pseudomonadota bacterium]
MRYIMVVGLTVVLFSLIVQWRARAREMAAEAAYPPVGQILSVEGVQVHAQVMGEGPDLILIHGASGNVRDFTFDFAQRLTERYRVIIFDRPGLGWTDRANDAYRGAWNTNAEPPLVQANILNKAAQQLGVIDPIVLGHSFGGAVAMAWALEHDPAAVVMVAGVANPWPGDLGWLYQVNSSSLGGALFVPILSAFTPQSVVADTLGSIFEPAKPPDGYLDHVGPGLTLRRQTLRANARQVNYLKPHITDMSKRYKDILIPLEMVHGDADTIVPMRIHSEPLSEQIEGANLTIVPNAGHMPHHSHPEAVIEAIDRAAARAGLR